MSQVFSEQVGGIVISVDVVDFDVLVLNIFAYGMIANVNVLRSLLRHRVGGDEERTLIITTDGYSFKIKTNLL